jgi:hypothetical protein
MSMLTEDQRGLMRPIAQALTLAYLAAACVFLWSSLGGLTTALHTYHPYFTWSLGVMTDARIVGLIDAGQRDLANAYAGLSQFSFLFVVLMVLVGVVAPFFGSARILSDPVKLMLMTVGSIFLFAAFTNGPVFSDMLWQARALPFNLANLPAFWFGTLITASLLIGWTLGLLAHDLVASFVATKEPPPRSFPRRR